MRVLVAGGTGVIGRQLVPLLVDTGHEVVATTRRPDKIDEVQRLGAKPLLLDILDAEATKSAVQALAPDAIIHQATALAELGNNIRKFDKLFATTNELRTVGTANLLAGARSAGTTRFIAQSYCGWPFAPVGGPVKDESAPLDANPPRVLRGMLEAIRDLEQQVSAFEGGVVLRYGGLYGPGTSLAADGPQIAAIRKRQIPVVGSGNGVWSFLHTHDAATAALAALTRGAGVYNIVDDEPAPVREWLPALAKALDAPPPRHVPAWLAKLVIGEGGVHMMTRIRGGSNQLAKRELAWKPSRPTWRTGIPEDVRGAVHR